MRAEMGLGEGMGLWETEELGDAWKEGRKAVERDGGLGVFTAKEIMVFQEVVRYEEKQRGLSISSAF